MFSSNSSSSFLTLKNDLGIKIFKFFITSKIKPVLAELFLEIKGGRAKCCPVFYAVWNCNHNCNTHCVCVSLYMFMCIYVCATPAN